MNVREWALIAFTILSQMAVGSFLILGIVHFYAVRKAGVEEADRLSDRAWLAIVVVMGLALVASLFHLGNPINAPRAVSNVATSWLSREILTGVVFAVLALVFAVMQWFKVGSFLLRNVITWVTAIVGLVMIYFESRIYMIQAEPAWNTFATPVSFYVTALLLGSLAMGVAFVANYAYVQSKVPECADTQCELMRGSLRWIAVLAIVLVGIDLIVIPVYLAYLSTSSGAGLATVKLLSGPFSAALIARLALGFLGAGIFGAFLYRNALSVGAFIIVLAGEVLGRYLFYATHVRIGI